MRAMSDNGKCKGADGAKVSGEHICAMNQDVPGVSHSYYRDKSESVTAVEAMVQTGSSPLAASDIWLRPEQKLSDAFLQQRRVGNAS
jgi:hypothetical protein